MLRKTQNKILTIFAVMPHSKVYSDMFLYGFSS